MTQRREFLQQAKTFLPEEHQVHGWYLSEDIEGVRCFWDGGISRYVATDKVPWASIKNPKTGERKIIKPFASGLWSQYGNPIIAPDWFLDKLPPFACDGVIHGEAVADACASHVPHSAFSGLQYSVWSSPTSHSFFQTGLVKNTSMDVQIDYQACLRFMKKHAPDFESINKGATLEQELFMMRGWNGWDEQVHIAPSIILPRKPLRAKAAVSIHAKRILDNGGTGMLIRYPHHTWVPKRVDYVLRFTVKVQ